MASQNTVALPYQCVSAIGDSGIICASKGSNVYVFGGDGSVLSSWQHPAAKLENESSAAVKNESQENEVTDDNADESAPPAKRRKLETESEERGDEKVVVTETAESGKGEAKGKGQKKDKGKAKRLSRNTAPEQNFVILIRSTADGGHVIAVTGQDKTIWVFEHDGKGQLKELSQRAMPKRPCDLVITPDNKTLLAADKFGDVYSLPLIQSPTTSDAAGAAGKPAPPTASVVKPPPSKGANALTVHSRRNLKALEDQRMQREKKAQKAQTGQNESGPAFEHELLLGHVSMLTSVAIAASPGGKPYILTADRDEHIRVSRGMPQAHIIKNYCLGHTSFINALCFPRPDVLVSGGGDNELYVWDWQAGILKSKAELLSHVKGVVPDATKVAVSGLYSQKDLGGSALVICERVPAVFVFKFADTLEMVQTLNLPGNPLDLTTYQIADKPTRLVAALDVAEGTTASGLIVFDFSEDTWNLVPDFACQETDARGPELTKDELAKIIYNVETLRKTDFDEAQETETPSKEPENSSAAQ